MCHTVTAINDCTGHGIGFAALVLFGQQRCAQCQHRLHGDVQCGHVKRFEHNFGRELAVFGFVQWRLRQEHVVLLGVAGEELIDAALPILFHVIPISDLTVAHRVIDVIVIALLVRVRSDIEIQI